MAARWSIGIGETRINGSGRDGLPATAIYDPELALDLPVRFSAASGMNAMAHAVESLYGIDTNPVVQAMAEEAIRKLGSGLPRIVQNPHDLEARTEVAYGAWLAANFRAEVGLEHAVAQRVRQWFNLDHAHTHAVATPYAIGFNAAAAPDAMARIKRALGVSDAARGLYDLSRCGWDCRPGSRVSACATKISPRPSRSCRPSDQPSARPVSKADLANIIGQAYAGEPPRF